MAENFEEQFLLMLVPYEQTSFSYYPSSSPNAGKPIPIDPVKYADAWTKEVRNDIVAISKTKVGSLLLNAIKDEGKVVTIRPKDQDYCNSGGYPGDILFNGSTPAGQLQIGTGHDLLFNPDTYSVGSKCESQHIQMGGFHIESNEILAHELVHTLRIVSGKYSETKLGKGLSFYDNNEEFNAVLVQGIYASERKMPIRSSHFRHFEIDKELDSSMKFFKSSSETFMWVERFCLDHPKFTRGFTHIHVRFNPIRAYYECSPQVKTLLRSATARRRDTVMPVVKAAVDFLRKEFRTP
jgi:hypothetical protein